MATDKLMRNMGQDQPMGFVAEANRLETASMTGFRRGMTCTNVIGHKLGVMFDVPEETPSAIAALIGKIERTLRRR